MTSDAKIGLLLGLVFIFLIAFVINGLPNFSEDKNNNKLTAAMVDSQNNPPGIGSKERKVSREVIRQDIRFAAPLPKSTSIIKETERAVVVEPVVAAVRSAKTKKSQVRKAKSGKRALPKVYIVREGDNLSVIARKLYGRDGGNKRINIIRIFEANRKILGAPDEVYVGQRLVIPPPLASTSRERNVSTTLASPIFEKVESIGRRHLPTVDSKAVQTKQYIVREGDSLWRIAAEQLGDGARYAEIAELNTGLLDSQDCLSVRMCLKLPAR